MSGLILKFQKKKRSDLVHLKSGIFLLDFLDVEGLTGGVMTVAMVSAMRFGGVKTDTSAGL